MVHSGGGTRRGTTLRSERGTSIVEFAMMIPIVMFLFMGIFDMGRYFYTQATLQHAIREAARFAVTGANGVDAQGRTVQRATAITQVIMDKATDLDLKVENLVIDPADGGGPNDVVTVTANFRFGFVTPGMQKMFSGNSHDFSVSTSMKNEPFSGLQGTAAKAGPAATEPAEGYAAYSY